MNNINYLPPPPPPTPSYNNLTRASSREPFPAPQLPGCARKQTFFSSLIYLIPLTLLLVACGGDSPEQTEKTHNLEDHPLAKYSEAADADIMRFIVPTSSWGFGRTTFPRICTAAALPPQCQQSRREFIKEAEQEGAPEAWIATLVVEYEEKCSKKALEQRCQAGVDQVLSALREIGREDISGAHLRNPAFWQLQEEVVAAYKEKQQAQEAAWQEKRRDIEAEHQQKEQDILALYEKKEQALEARIAEANKADVPLEIDGSLAAFEKAKSEGLKTGIYGSFTSNETINLSIAMGARMALADDRYKELNAARAVRGDALNAAQETRNAIQKEAGARLQRFKQGAY